MMTSVNSGWVALWRELLAKSIWVQSSPQCCKVLITLLLLANHEENEWEYKGVKYHCEPGQLITSIDSLVSTCGAGVTKDGVRSAILRLCKLGFITNVSTKTGRLITIVNWDKYQNPKYGDPKGNPNGATKPNPKVTPKLPQSYPKATPPNNNNNNNNNDNNETIKEKEIKKEKEKNSPGDDQASDWSEDIREENLEDNQKPKSVVMDAEYWKEYDRKINEELYGDRGYLP